MIFGGLALMLMSGVLLIYLVSSELLSTTADGIPRESFFASNQNIGDWGEDLTDLGGGYSVGEEFHLTIDDDVWEHPLIVDAGFEWWGYQNWTHSSHYGNLSASVKVRVVDAAPEAVGCLMVRQDPTEPDEPLDNPEDLLGYDRYSFSLCLSEYYGLYVSWEDQTANNGIGLTDYWYPEPEINEYIRPVSEWNELKVIAKDETMWMFLNGEYAGTTTYPGPSRGAVGVHIIVPYGTEATIAFKDLEIRRLGLF